MLPPYFTDEEIAGLCEGLIRSSSQIRYLTSLGFNVKQKPNGKPLIARSNFEDVMRSCKQSSTGVSLKNIPPGPNESELLSILSGRK